MKLLVIEDNWLLAETLKSHLATHYTVDLAVSGEEGLDKATVMQYGAIILDLGLPDKNGYHVCQELRQNGITAPILIITGTQSIDTRIKLLDSGADDYLIKPFNTEELRARVGALLRRPHVMTTSRIIAVKDLQMDINRRQVTRSGVAITLRRKEFDILEYLVTNRGQALSRSMIFDHVWESGKEGWNNTVDVHIKRLRDKVDKPFRQPLIKTAYGIGYMVDDTV